MAKKPDTLTKPTFEAALGELESTVERLEQGELPLEESLALFEKGVAALKQCHVILDHAEKRIQILVKGARGEPELQEINLSEAGEPSVGDGSDNPPLHKKTSKQSLDSAPQTRHNASSTSSESEDQSGLW